MSTQKRIRSAPRTPGAAGVGGYQLLLSCLIPFGILLLLTLYVFDPGSFSETSKHASLRALRVALFGLAACVYLNAGVRSAKLHLITRRAYIAAAALFIVLGAVTVFESYFLGNRFWYQFYTQSLAAFASLAAASRWILALPALRKQSYPILAVVPTSRLCLWFALSALLLFCDDRELNSLSLLLLAYTFFLSTVSSEAEKVVPGAPALPQLGIFATAVVLLCLLISLQLTVSAQDQLSDRQRTISCLALKPPMCRWC